MATPSSILAWRIPWTEEPGGLQSMRSQRVRHDLVTKQHQQSYTILVSTHNNGTSHSLWSSVLSKVPSMGKLYTLPHRTVLGQLLNFVLMFPKQYALMFVGINF